MIRDAGQQVVGRRVVEQREEPRVARESPAEVGHAVDRNRVARHPRRAAEAFTQDPRRGVGHADPHDPAARGGGKAGVPVRTSGRLRTIRRPGALSPTSNVPP